MKRLGYHLLEFHHGRSGSHARAEGVDNPVADERPEQIGLLKCVVLELSERSWIRAGSRRPESGEPNYVTAVFLEVCIGEGLVPTEHAKPQGTARGNSGHLHLRCIEV